LRAAIERSDVRALLILDASWYGSVPAEFACRTGKPAFLAGRLGDWIPRGDALVQLAAETETTLMPDFRHRYTPATSRLKELIATRLGRLEEVLVEARVSSPSGNGQVSMDPSARLEVEVLIAALDWTCHLIGTAPAEVRGTVGPTGAEEAVISFKRSAAGGAPASARIVLHPDSAETPDWKASIRCQRGSAELAGGTHIDWKAGAERRSESLSNERGGVEVMLDHFSRRVIGGLIPVPTLDDLCQAARLAGAAVESRRTGRPVTVES
jgi:predicted dehydrogenase